MPPPLSTEKPTGRLFVDLSCSFCNSVYHFSSITGVDVNVNPFVYNCGLCTHPISFHALDDPGDCQLLDIVLQFPTPTTTITASQYKECIRKNFKRLQINLASTFPISPMFKPVMPPLPNDTSQQQPTTASSLSAITSSSCTSAPPHITFGNVFDVELKENEYGYFRFHVDNPNKSIVIECKVSSGDPDLFLIPSSTAAVADHDLPARGRYTWCSPYSRGSKTLTVDSNDAEFAVGWFFLAVHDSRENVKASIMLAYSDSPRGAVADHALTNDQQKDEPMTTQCGICKRPFMFRELSAHQLEQCTPPTRPSFKTHQEKKTPKPQY